MYKWLFKFFAQLVSGLSLDFLYLILTPVGPLYLLLFFWTYKLLKKDSVRAAQLLYMILAMALAYLVGSFILSFVYI